MSIQKELESKLQEFKSLELAQKYLDKIVKDIAKKELQLPQLQSELEKEYQDVEKLEKMSMRAVFENILVDKERQMEKERQEYLNAYLKYHECKKSLELLRYEQAILKKKLIDNASVKSELIFLIKKREKSLMQEDALANQLISDINKKLDDLISFKKEMEEVIILGVKANVELERTMEVLKQVISWGEYVMNELDIQFTKKIFINKARDHALNAKKILEHFEYELIDIYGDQNKLIQSKLRNFNLFVEEFLKNLVIDWVLYNKIKKAVYPFQQINSDVKKLVSILKKDLKELDKKESALIEKKEQIIQELN